MYLLPITIVSCILNAINSKLKVVNSPIINSHREKIKEYNKHSNMSVIFFLLSVAENKIKLETKLI